MYHNHRMFNLIHMRMEMSCKIFSKEFNLTAQVPQYSDEIVYWSFEVVK